jgi:hypothetical protein
MGVLFDAMMTATVPAPLGLLSYTPPEAIGLLELSPRVQPDLDTVATSVEDCDLGDCPPNPVDANIIFSALQFGK